MVIKPMKNEKETTTITLSRTNKARLDSVLKHGESYDFGMTILLLAFAKPKFGSGGAFGNRTVYPLFSQDEINDILKILLPQEPSNVKRRGS